MPRCKAYWSCYLGCQDEADHDFRVELYAPPNGTDNTKWDMEDLE